MAPPRKRLYTDLEIISSLMQDGSDDEEAVVRCYDVNEREEIDQDDEGTEFVDVCYEESIDFPDQIVDLDMNPESASTSSTCSSSRSSSRASEPANLVDLAAQNSPPSQLDLDLELEHTHGEGQAQTLNTAPQPQDDGDEIVNDWSKVLTDFPLVPPFTGDSGFQVEIEGGASPLTFYALFVTPALIKSFKSQTNLYARQVITEKLRGDNVSPRSIYKKWQPVREDEIYSFLAILLHMGLVKKNLITDYWSHDLTITSPFAAKCMDRERFRSILSFFHLNNNQDYVPQGQPGHDPLHKIRPLYDHLRQVFPAVYRPHQNVCIDEALCPWRGRSRMRVYMRDKPVKWGIKLYQLCESGSGYIWQFEVMANDPNIDNTPYAVCHRLVDPLKNVGHTLFVDNYYCNPKLCDSLAAEDTMVVGTVRSNRIGMPKDLVQQPMNQGDMDYRRKHQLLALRWKDKRDVHILTTKHTPTMQQHTTRTETKLKPTAVIDYTQNMSGVDLNDQLVSYMPFHRKTVKWWKKLAFHLLTVCFIQAHILHNKHRKMNRQRTWKLEKFACTLCLALASKGTQLQQQNDAEGVPAPEMNRLIGRHFPVPYDAEGGKRRGTCVVCYAKMAKTEAGRKERKNKAQKTPFKCSICDKSLCVFPCFQDFHTKENYAT